MSVSGTLKINGLVLNSDVAESIQANENRGDIQLKVDSVNNLTVVSAGKTLMTIGNYNYVNGTNLYSMMDLTSNQRAIASGIGNIIDTNFASSIKNVFNSTFKTTAPPVTLTTNFSTSNNIPYVFQVPPNYNGCVFVYSHGWILDAPLDQFPDLDNVSPFNSPYDTDYYIRERRLKFQTKKYLLDMGYALIGSQFGTQGYNIQSAVEENRGLIEEFKRQYPNTTKVIVWGDSLGSLTTQRFAEKYPNTVDAVGLMDHVSDFTVLYNKYAGNVSWFMKHTFNSNLVSYGYSSLASVSSNQVNNDVNIIYNNVVPKLSENSWAVFDALGVLGQTFKNGYNDAVTNATTANTTAITSTTGLITSGNSSANGAYVAAVFGGNATAIGSAKAAAEGAGASTSYLNAVATFIGSVFAGAPAAATGDQSAVFAAVVTLAAITGDTSPYTTTIAVATTIVQAYSATASIELAKPLPVFGSFTAAIGVPLKSPHYGNTTDLLTTGRALLENFMISTPLGFSVSANLEKIAGGIVLNNSNANFASKISSTLTQLLGPANLTILQTIDTYNNTYFVAGASNSKLYNPNFFAQPTSIITKPTVTLQAQYDPIAHIGNTYHYEYKYTSNLAIGLGNSNMLLNLINVPSTSSWTTPLTAPSMSGTNHAVYSDNNYILVASLLIHAAYTGSNLSFTNKALLQSTVNNCDPLTHPLIYASNINMIGQYYTGAPAFL